ncbi:spermidine synthase [Mycena galopus ATCC 62051]|nr:spermidine synthase [Mycena galopus ATCC 62051]
MFPHPSIVDGWFREISSQWPGQAITLKVNKILHIEKSLYQDILVFESVTYGNVLILDGVIQCTERDEFFYHEMIAHLPLATHPNPRKVLVIGGGDGGVVREVLKHTSVERVVLCEIDEAVVRISREFFPHMAACLASPKVAIHIGDGIKFLAENEATYDVIITDSSDPVGPAEFLYQQPYFQLLHEALAPGGNISVQGQTLDCGITNGLFPVSEYASAIMPTYTSGHIGFIIASKDVTRDLRTPVHDVVGTKYYNRGVHGAAFVLPEFGRGMLEDNREIRLLFGPTAKEAEAELDGGIHAP